MKANITFRAYEKQDAPYLENIIRKTWNYDLFSSPKVAKQMAKLYLASCLANQTYTKVALIDDTPVGIIMAKNIKSHKNKLTYVWSQLVAGAQVFRSKEGRKTANLFAGINDVDEKLLEERHKNYEGELAFFAVSEECRGTGIGKKLYHMVVDYFIQEGIQEFYLYTDSSCNYGFYEHQGMVRCGEKIYEVPLKVKNEMKFYLYEGCVHFPQKQ